MGDMAEELRCATTADVAFSIERVKSTARTYFSHDRGMGPEAVGVRRPRPERSRRLFRVPTRAGTRAGLTRV